MLTSEHHSYLVPFPPIPESIKAKFSMGDLSLRPFGYFEADLVVNFNQKARPHIVTQILHCCTRDKNGATPDEVFFWELTIGKRIECLLTIVTLGDAPELSFQLQCSNEACGQQMEIEISLAELTDLQHQADDTDDVIIQIEDENLHLRKPTGRDQLEWMKRSFSDETAAVKAMIQSLILDNGEASSNQKHYIPDEWFQSINEAMEEFDPLVNFSMTVYCPHCNQAGRYELNLEEFALGELHKAQLDLLEAIHRLASHYHWSEEQILSLPPWRRFHYLALIEKEESR